MEISNEEKYKTREIVIEGAFVGKQRPRFTTINGFPRAITAQKTVEYENLVKMVWTQTHGDFHYDKDVQLHVDITVFCQLQSIHYGKKGINSKGKEKLNGVVRPTIKPDVDNIAKTILDALNKIAYYDDSQVVGLSVNKWYKELPKVIVRISIAN